MLKRVVSHLRVMAYWQALGSVEVHHCSTFAKYLAPYFLEEEGLLLLRPHSDYIKVVLCRIVGNPPVCIWEVLAA